MDIRSPLPRLPAAHSVLSAITGAPRRLVDVLLPPGSRVRALVARHRRGRRSRGRWPILDALVHARVGGGSAARIPLIADGRMHYGRGRSHGRGFDTAPAAPSPTADARASAPAAASGAAPEREGGVSQVTEAPPDTFMDVAMITHRVTQIEHYLIDPSRRPPTAAFEEGIVHAARYAMAAWRLQNEVPRHVETAALVLRFVGTAEWTPEQWAVVQRQCGRGTTRTQIESRYRGGLFFCPEYTPEPRAPRWRRRAFDEAPILVPKRWRTESDGRLLVPPGPVLPFCDDQLLVCGTSDTWELAAWCAAHTAMSQSEIDYLRVFYGTRIRSVRSYAAVALRLPNERVPLGALVFVADHPIRQDYSGIRAHLAVQLQEMVWSIARLMQTTPPRAPELRQGAE